MAEHGGPGVEALLAAARDGFAARLPAKIAELGRLVEREEWDAARRAAHWLRGSAGTYGFIAVGGTAGAIEDLLLGAKGAPGPEARARLGILLGEVLAHAESAARSGVQARTGGR